MKNKFNVRVARNFLATDEFQTNKSGRFLVHDDPEATTVEGYRPVREIAVANAHLVVAHSGENGFGCQRVILGIQLPSMPKSVATWKAMKFDGSHFVDKETDVIVPDGSFMAFTPKGCFYSRRWL